MNIQDFLQLMLEAGASDLHVTQDSPPLIRVHGELKLARSTSCTPSRSAGPLSHSMRAAGVIGRSAADRGR
ncbi:MAG: hypothetical protein NTZ61_03135, partial [Proteobacteria bacterium]|nr:hypothetical protein [Pseudomonadota bacterium]